MVVALRLGNQSVESPDFMKRAAKEGERHEDWIAKDLAGYGYEVSEATYCAKCGRHGEHVELGLGPYGLIGHIDRKLVDGSGKKFVAEFKALGRFRAQKLCHSIESGGFKREFREYAMQVSCYHHATELPILYCVKNRDTGLLRTYVIDPPFTLEEIDDYLLSMEISARKGVLPPCAYKRGDFERTICHTGYLCAGDDKETGLETGLVAPSDDEFLEAATSWKEASRLKAEAETAMEKSRAVFMGAVKAAGVKSLVNHGIKISYVGPGETVSYPRVKLEAIVPEELLAQCREAKARDEFIKVQEVGE